MHRFFTFLANTANHLKVERLKFNIFSPLFSFIPSCFLFSPTPFSPLHLSFLCVSLELHGCQQHHDGVSGTLCGRIRQRLLGGGQQSWWDRLYHGWRALCTGGKWDFQLPPRPRVRTFEPLGHAGAEAHLPTHTQGKLPPACALSIDLFWPCLYLALLCIHHILSLFISLFSSLFCFQLPFSCLLPVSLSFSSLCFFPKIFSVLFFPTYYFLHHFSLLFLLSVLSFHIVDHAWGGRASYVWVNVWMELVVVVHQSFFSKVSL